MAKAKKKRQEQQRGGVGPVVGVDVWRGFVERRQAEGEDAGRGVVVEVEEQDAQQHQHRASQRVEEELDGGVEFARAAPDADQQVHGHEHRFPENEEEEEIERHEDAEHARLQDQKPDVVFLDAILDGGPGGEDRDPAQQRGEHDEQEGDAVDADHIARADGGDPVVGRALDELEAGLETLVPEPGHERQRDEKTAEREDVGDPADGVFVVLGDKQEHQRAHQRREEDDGENVVVH